MSGRNIFDQSPEEPPLEVVEEPKPEGKEILDEINELETKLAAARRRWIEFVRDGAPGS